MKGTTQMLNDNMSTIFFPNPTPQDYLKSAFFGGYRC